MSSVVKKCVIGTTALAASAALLYALHKKSKKPLANSTRKTPYSIGNRPIYVVHTSDQFEELVKEFDLLNETVMGFDAEWTKQCPLSIVQLSFHNVNIIIQVERLDVLPPPSLNVIMGNDSILKTGVGIGEDLKKVLQYLVVDAVHGVVDIADVAKRMGHTDLKTSLQHLTEKYLHVLISKDPKIRCGNWDLEDLSEDQIKYAAGDSYYSREVFMYFYNLYCSSVKDSQLLSALEWCLVNHMEKSIIDGNDCDQYHVRVIDQKGESTSSVHLKDLAPFKKGGYSKRKAPIYEDCRLLSPDGQLLCRIGHKKLDWYVVKGLGVVVSENPYTVQLTFEPKSRTPSNSTRLSPTDNRCVVCGRNKNYVCHSILPHKYRRYLPEAWKSHNNHDNVVLCIPCSIRCNKYDDIYSRKIILQHGYDPRSISVVINKEVLETKKVAGILLKLYRGEIHPPHSRKLELEGELLRFLKKYNVKYWIEKEDASNNGVFEIVSEEEFANRKEEEFANRKEEDALGKSGDEMGDPSEEKQQDDMKNPFEHMELDEKEGVFNFDIPLLEKITNLSAYSIDPNYVTPEERVMKDILSSPDPAISF